MKYLTLLVLIGTAAFISLTSCSSGSKASAPVENTALPGTETVLNKSIADARSAAATALNSIGCEVDLPGADYVRGKRPSSYGGLGSSGGETVTVFLTFKDVQRTGIRVVTQKSFMRSSGQKDWGPDIIAALGH